MEVKTKEAWENYKKEEEANIKQKQVESEMRGVLDKIRKFEFQTSIGTLFDENISLMQPISSLPEDVYNDFKDFKAYELSRFGITKKFQILIFPFLDDELFLSEFLGYFMRNSCFSKENPSKIKGDHFSFHLIGIHISAYTPAISDEETDMFCTSSYLLNSNELRRQIENHNMKRCIYMIFDTYIGEGSQILSDVVLDVKINNNVLSEPCVEKLRKRKIYEFDEKMTLKKFAVKHMKTMRVALKLFHQITTFHPISLQTKENFEAKFNRSNDVCLIFMKIFKNNIISSENNEEKKENNKNNEGDEPKEKQMNILKHLIKRTTMKGLDLIGMKTIYFHEESYQEFVQTFEKSKFFEPNIPFLVFAFAGYDVCASTFNFFKKC